MSTAITLFLMSAMTFSLIALPFATAQPALIMNLPGTEGDIPNSYVLFGSTQPFDIDLNGGPGGGQDIELWCWYPGRVDSTYIGTYVTASNGDLDVYDFDFNETGDFLLYWAYPVNASISNVEIARVVTKLPPTELNQYFLDKWGGEIPTWVYGVVTPNPCGVNQEVWIGLFNFQVPPGASAGNDIRWEYSVTITRPDGQTERIPASGTIVSDSTGSAFTTYTPAATGNYTIEVKFHELLYRWTDRDYEDITFAESTHTSTLVVQQEPVIPLEESVYPLPTEYWKRPIEGQNNAWFQVSSNWLSGPKDEDYGGGWSDNRFQTDGVGPNSPHILWTKVTEDGGVVGGANFSVPGEVFNAGHQYQTRWGEQIIMWGRLYYELPRTWSGGGGGWICVDLRTGEEIWYSDEISDPAFGYYYDWDDMNQHGITNPGWLFTNNFGQGIHPRYGTEDGPELDNVPSGETLLGPNGEHLRYVLDSDGWLGQWNSSRVFKSGTGTYDASDEDNYDWNVSAPWRVGMSSVSVESVILDDILLGRNGSHPSAPSYGYPEEVTVWAVSLKPGSRGQLMWMKNYETTTQDNTNLLFRRAGEGVFVFVRTPEMIWEGYDMYTGNKLWESEAEGDFNPYAYYITSTNHRVYGHSIAYGKLFSTGYGGAVFCYDLYNGTLLWRYEAPTYRTKFPYYTMMIGAIADGKIYLGTHEHSADTPLFKGNRIRCLDVNTGEEVWTMLGWSHPSAMAVADGTLVYWNNYDHQVYAIAKGPSSTTALIRNNVITHGGSVLVEGSVIDISAGTKQHEQAMRFPNGVPAVSDESMGEWMEYVYMQKPKPTDVTGVEIVVTVLDPNGNSYEVGRTTNDASGTFCLDFEPEVPGKYTVTATFAGSESYWPSYAQTYLLVEEAPATTPVPTAEPESVADLYFLPMSIGMIIAIVIVLILLVLMMLRKR